MSSQDKKQRFAAFRYRDFSIFWYSQIVSFIGTQMQIVALNWHIYLLTHSAIALGLIGLVRFVPLVIFSLIGGTAADTFNRKKLLLIAISAQMVCSLFLAYTSLTHIITPIILYILTALAATAVAFELPSQQALVPNLVAKKDLINATSLFSIMRQVSLIVGPSLAGILLARFDVGIVYFLNALSFIAVISAIFMLQTSGAIENKTADISLSSILAGLSFVKTRTIIWSTMLLDFFSTFFASATALLPIYAQDILHVGAQGLGFLYAAPAIGAVLAGFIMAHMGTIRKQGKVLLISVGFYAVGTILFGISKNFVFSILALSIVGAGDAVSTIIRNTIRQLSTPDHLRGRMIAVNMIFFIGGPQLGEFEAGVLAAALTAPVSVVIGGVATLVVVSIMTVAIPKLRDYRGNEAIEI